MEMNSHYRNPAASLMGHSQMYDDTYLRRRVKCLTSGLLLCFVIGVAAIGISVIVLLKLNKLHEDPAFTSDLKNEVAELQMEVDGLRSQLLDYEQVMMTANDKENVLNVDSPIVGEEPSRKVDDDSDEDDDEDDDDDKDDDDDTHKKHHHQHGNMTDHSQHTNITDHSNHTLQEDTEEVEDPQSAHDHHHGISEDSVQPEPESEPEPAAAGTLCDDSDLCLPSESSAEIGSIDDVLEGFAIEGSGDDCIQFARPHCPLGADICYTDDRCPVPICCLKGFPIDDLNYLRH